MSEDALPPSAEPAAGAHQPAPPAGDATSQAPTVSAAEQPVDTMRASATAVLDDPAPELPKMPQIVTPPPPAGFLASTWPGPGEWGGPFILIAIMAGALGFAVFVPLGQVGIGWVLGGTVAAVAVAVVAIRARAPIPVSSRVWRIIWGASALALLSVLAFRNAWWLVTFCVLGALGCATLAVTGGRVIRTMLLGFVVLPASALRSLPWVVKQMARGGARRDGTTAPESKSAHVGRLLWSVVVTAALLLIFGALLRSADAAFASVIDRLVPEISAGRVVVWVFLFCAGAALTTAAVYLVSAPPDLRRLEKPGQGRLRRTEWALPIAALDVLFAGFVAVQVTVLFGGQEHVLATSGLTYAEYARSGFWQLATVTVLTLLVVAGTGRWAQRATRGQRVTVRVLLGTLSGLSLVIVASALYRMYTYQQAYSFTGERIFVMAFELLLGLIFVMILIAGVRLSGAWVPRGMVAGAVVMLLSLAVLNPEAYAAQRNVQRFQDSHKIDLWYLRALSADATPALATLPDELRKCTLMWISKDLARSDPWYGWNAGREEARRVLRELGPEAIGDCAKARRYDYQNTR